MQANDNVTVATKIVDNTAEINPAITPLLRSGI